MAEETASEWKRYRCVASKEMQQLRVVHERLNRYCRATEIAYHFTGYHLPERTTNPNHKAYDELRYLPAQAWRLSRRGIPQYFFKLGALVEDLDNGLGFIWRSNMLYFYSAFETYFRLRVVPRLNSGKKQSGERRANYILQLDEPEILAGDEERQKYVPRLKVVLGADLCRHLRNDLTHIPGRLPRGIDDPTLVRWEDNTWEAVRKTSGWADKESISRATIHQTVVAMVGNAINLQAAAARENGPVPDLEYLYMIFFFGHLNRLAFRLDQVLLTEDEIIRHRTRYGRLKSRWENAPDSRRRIILRRALWNQGVNADERDVKRREVMIDDSWDHTRDWPDTWAGAARQCEEADAPHALSERARRRLWCQGARDLLLGMPGESRSGAGGDAEAGLVGGGGDEENR